MLKRQGIIVYFKNPKVLKQLKRVGNVTYFHKKRKYAVLYVHTHEVDVITQELRKFRHIRKVELSYFDYSVYDLEFDVK